MSKKTKIDKTLDRYLDEDYYKHKVNYFKNWQNAKGDIAPMKIDYALENLKGDRTYTRNDLIEIFRKENKELNDATFRWMLYNMQLAKRLFRVGYDEYTTSERDFLPEYRPIYTEDVLKIENFLKEKYPELSFVMFESVVLNEFLNHQIAQNTIYVQVEKDLSTFIFDLLKQELGGMVLYKPNRAEFSRYWTRGCVVVLELISQAPLSSSQPHEITIEKLLVDIIADKSIEATYSPAELPEIIRNIRENYRVDVKKMNRYAGRRGKAKIIEEYMRDEIKDAI